MSEIAKAQNILRQYADANTALNSFFQPHVKSWLQLQLMTGRFQKEDVAQDFFYNMEESTDETICFTSEEWDLYGGYETRPMQYIWIPLDFIENPEKYVREAEQTKAEREKRKKTEAKRSRAAEVRRLKKQLLDAEKKLGEGK